MVYPDTNITMITFTPLASAASLRRSRAHVGTDMIATLRMIVKIMDAIYYRIHRPTSSVGGDQHDINIYFTTITAYISSLLPANVEVSVS